MSSLKIGFLGVTSALLYDESSIKMYEKSKGLLIGLAKGHKVVAADEIFNDSSEGIKQIKKFIEEWEDTRFDLIIIQSVGFGLGIGPVDLAMTQINTPIVMWAVPEPELKEGGLLEKNAWCGANMHTSHLYRLGARYENIYGTPDDKNVSSSLEVIIKVAEVIKKLHHTTIGTLGGRVSGYFDSNFDELSLRKSLGIKFEFIDLSEVLAEFDKISESEVKVTSDKIYFGKRIDINEHINNSTKLFISIKRIIERYGLSAVALKCWPDFQNLLDISVCSVIGSLGDELIQTSCEGDMLGAVSMVIMSSFNNDVSSSMDISDFDFNNNSFYVYHCGSCPTKMAPDKNMVEHRGHSLFTNTNNPGIVSEFYLKTGKCGVLRLSEDRTYRNKYRMFFAEGEGIKGTHIRGNNLEIKLKNNKIEKFIETIMNNGFEHHYAFGYNPNRELLLMFCKWLNIETFFI
jgi:L-fucose isomerase-like protein